MVDRLYHPSFPRPENVNARIWRYFSFEKFRWLVEHRRLYMPRPEQLASNDAFEGTMPRAEAAWWDEAINHGKGSGNSEIAEANKVKIQRFIRAFRTGWFISCWHLEEHENFAFWEIYGRGGESVAIVTTFAKLESCLPTHVNVGCVRYIDYESQMFETRDGKLPNLYDHIMYKRHFYSYEKEIRAVASGHFAAIEASNDISNNMVDGSYAPTINLRELILEVIVHPRASLANFNTVKSLCKGSGLPVPRLSGLSSEPVN